MTIFALTCSSEDSINEPVDFTGIYEGALNKDGGGTFSTRVTIVNSIILDFEVSTNIFGLTTFHDVEIDEFGKFTTSNGIAIYWGNISDDKIRGTWETTSLNTGEIFTGDFWAYKKNILK